MIPEQVQENNELISRFMKLDFGNGGHGYPIGTGWCISENLKYHSSWDWLMSVVEKIESIQMEKHGYFGVHIHSNACTIQGTKFRSELRDEVYYFDIYSDTKLNAAWQAVTQFIIWYNQQKQQP